MKTKKDVSDGVGLILLALAFVSLSGYDNFVSSEGADNDVSYDDIISEIDDSLMKTYANDDRIKSLQGDLKTYRDELESALYNYTSIKKEILQINDKIKQVDDEINATRANSDKLVEKRAKLQNLVEGAGYDAENGTEIGLWFFYLSLFISANLFIWFEISTYYREKSFIHRKF